MNQFVLSFICMIIHIAMQTTPCHIAMYIWYHVHDVMFSHNIDFYNVATSSQLLTITLWFILIQWNLIGFYLSAADISA